MYTDSYNVSLTLEGKCTRYRNLLAYSPFERCSEISSRGEVMNDTHVFKRHIQTHCFEIIWIISNPLSIFSTILSEISQRDIFMFKDRFRF